MKTTVQMEEVRIEPRQRERWIQRLQQEIDKQRQEDFHPNPFHETEEKLILQPNGSLVISQMVFGWGKISMVVPAGSWKYLEEM